MGGQAEVDVDVSGEDDDGGMLSVTVFHRDGSATLRSWFVGREALDDLTRRLTEPDVTYLVPLGVRVDVAKATTGAVIMTRPSEEPV